MAIVFPIPSFQFFEIRFLIMVMFSIFIQLLTTYTSTVKNAYVEMVMTLTTFMNNLCLAPWRANYIQNELWQQSFVQH